MRWLRFLVAAGCALPIALIAAFRAALLAGPQVSCARACSRRQPGVP
jgi:hypothetical protein